VTTMRAAAPNDLCPCGSLLKHKKCCGWPTGRRHGTYAHPTGWKQTGSQGGSNPGGVFTDPAGGEHYVKFYANDEQGRSEVLANEIYRALGISAPESRNIMLDGKKAVEAPMIPGVKRAGGAHALRDNPGVLDGFVADAFLANHDVVGTCFDNVVLDGSGKAHRIDNGGAMFFRAQGKPKADGPQPFVDNDVPEIDSMRDPSKAQSAGLVFNQLTDEHLAAQAKKLVAKLPDEKIDKLVAASGLSGKDAEKYSATLKGRRDAIAQRFLSACLCSNGHQPRARGRYTSER
jgi:SEC-C motif